MRDAVAGGARVVQFRSKSTQASVRWEQASSLFAVCRNANVPFIINDDIELARALDVRAVHLGKSDAPISAAREALGTNCMIGVSCYDDLQRAVAAQRDGASYVAFGSFFASSVKPGAVRAPIDLLRRARAQLSVPIVAIGGITPDNAGELIAAGADAIAVISALFDVSDTRAAAQTFSALFPNLPHARVHAISMP